jgi:anti-sigma-K factor RskA
MTAVPSRLEELIADRVLWGLDEHEDRELESFGERAQLELTAYEVAGAEIIRSLLASRAEAVPTHVLARLQASAQDFLSGNSRAEAPRPAGAPRPAPALVQSGVEPGRPFLAWSGWLAAAALLIAWLVGDRASESTPITEQLDVLQRSADVQRLDWESGPQGEVVWSAGEQRGFLVLRGLLANDPTEAQYQLWIFDRTRSDAHPVDGGVFDVSDAAETVVAIDAKLPVREAFGFAITREVPGGVVVSARGADGTGTIVAAAGL